MHYLFLGVAILLRWLPHPWSVTPIGGIGLFAGTWVSLRVAWVFPLIPLVIGDAIGGFYDPFIMAFVYLGVALSVVWGRLFLARKRTALRFGGAITVNALVFYALSNFPVWVVYYPNTLAGLVECYLKGLPFLRNQIIGDTVFVALIFGGHWLAQRYRVKAHAAA